jgi:hypothetical protein
MHTGRIFTYITWDKFIRVCKSNPHMPTSKLVTHVYLDNNMEKRVSQTTALG